MDLTFSPLVAAVAFDIFQNFGGGSQSGVDESYLVSVFGISGLLGSTTVIVPSSGFGFFGVASDSSDIQSISVLHAGAYEVIDDVAFGDTAAVPEPGTALMLAGGLLLVASSRKLLRV